MWFVLLLPLYWVTVLGDFCPKWNCTAMSFDICVAIYENQLLVNSNGCDKDFYCSYEDVMNWYLPKHLPSRDVFNCTRQEFIANVTASTTNVFCGNRDPNDQLLSGTHPKLCVNSADCETVGGWTTDCLCGLDGVKYCQPESGSTALDGFWTLCDQYKNKTNDPRVSLAAKNYWEYYQRYYTLVVSAQPCVWKTLNEFLTLSGLQQSAMNFLSTLALPATLVCLTG